MDSSAEIFNKFVNASFKFAFLKMSSQVESSSKMSMFYYTIGIRILLAILKVMENRNLKTFISEL
jgi:hypothetical protein